jgi:hypothetical protein
MTPLPLVSHNATTSRFPQRHFLQFPTMLLPPISHNATSSRFPLCYDLQIPTTPFPPVSHNVTAFSFLQHHFLQFPTMLLPPVSHNATASSFPQCYGLQFPTTPLPPVSHNATASSFPQRYFLQCLATSLPPVSRNFTSSSFPQRHFLQFPATPLPPVSRNVTSSSFPQLHFLQFRTTPLPPVSHNPPLVQWTRNVTKASIKIAACPIVAVTKIAVLFKTHSHVVQWRNNTHTHTLYSTPSFPTKSLTLHRPHSQLPMTWSANDWLLGVSLPLSCVGETRAVSGERWAVSDERHGHIFFKLWCQTVFLSILTAVWRQQNVTV